ncbi:MAG: acyltransferase family protein [Acidimicrobiia bacterium]
MSSGESPRLADLAGATPVTRDRYVDFLRAFSVLVVVFGHWLGAAIVWQGGVLSAQSALDVVPGLWVITWFLQVMPIFFFVGGFSNYVTYQGLRRLDEGGWTFFRGRASRLLRPTAVFLVFWAIVAPFAMRLPALPPAAGSKALPVLAGPLWFLGVYLVLVAFSPLMINLHLRYRWATLLTLVVLPVVVDLFRFVGGISWIGNINILFVWLLVHQLGFFYADGTFDRVSQRFFGLLALVGYAVMFALTRLAVYPSSMVGCCADEISNMAPPTLAILALGVGQIGLAMLLRPAITRWLNKKRSWTAVIAVNATIMTIYLWHLSALVIAVATLFPLGFPQPEVGSGLWWAIRPLWLAVLTFPLAGLVALFGRFERPDLDPAERDWNLEKFYAL